MDNDRCSNADQRILSLFWSDGDRENLGENDRFHNKEKGLMARDLSKETGGHLIEGVYFEGESIHTWHATDHMELRQLRSKVGLKRHIVEVLVSDLRLAAVLGWKEEEVGHVNGNAEEDVLPASLGWVRSVCCAQFSHKWVLPLDTTKGSFW